MKIKIASLFGVTLALAVIAFAAPAQARNYDSNNYLSSGISSNFNGGGGGCGGGQGHHHGQRAWGNQNQGYNQGYNQSQVGIYPNAPFSNNTAYGYNQNVGISPYAMNSRYAADIANIQQQLSFGNLNFNDRSKLMAKLAKLQAKAANDSYGYNNGSYNNGGLLSNLRNQYLNNGLNNGYNNGNIGSGLLSNGLGNSGYANQVRGMLGF